MKNKLNVRILVCCHKKDVMATQEPYMPIHVGKALHPELDLGIQGDNTGDNISDKNGSYCELTGMYWAWKNLNNVDIIGLCHYRRYFDFHKQVPLFMDNQMISQTNFQNIDLNIPKEVINKVINRKVVVAKKNISSNSLFDTYSIFHNSIDIRKLEMIVYENCEEKYHIAFDKIMKDNNKFSPFNMFIMRKDEFDSYCSWLFPIMSKLEISTDVTRYDSYQSRLIGFVSERLFNVWLYANDIELIEKPVMQIVQTERKKNPMKCLYNRVIDNASFCIKQLRYDRTSKANNN